MNPENDRDGDTFNQIMMNSFSENTLHIFISHAFISLSFKKILCLGKLARLLSVGFLLLLAVLLLDKVARL